MDRGRVVHDNGRPLPFTMLTSGQELRDLVSRFGNPNLLAAMGEGDLSYYFGNFQKNMASEVRYLPGVTGPFLRDGWEEETAALVDELRMSSASMGTRNSWWIEQDHAKERESCWREAIDR